VSSLMWFTFAIIVGALLVAGLSIWYERRNAPTSIDAPPEPQSVNEWLHTRAHLIAYIGVGIVAFAVLWNVGGPDITLASAAVLGVLFIAIGVLGAHGDKADADDQGATDGDSS